MLQEHLDNDCPPVIAILRGVRPDEVVEIGTALVEQGLRIIEVPLNSPQPLESVKLLANAFASRALIGVGTVLDAHSVEQAASAGARLIVTPNTNPEVIGTALALRLDVVPGFMTATEALAAFQAGARHLKLFPASSAGTTHMKALLEVLPGACGIWPTGGTNVDNLEEWLGAGARGIGIGSALYRAGSTAETVRSRAARLVDAWGAFQSRRGAQRPVLPTT